MEDTGVIFLSSFEIYTRLFPAVSDWGDSQASLWDIIFNDTNTLLER